MNPKIERLESEIEKTKEKIVSLQERLANMELQKTDMENSEIIAMVRKLNMSADELTAFFSNGQKEDKISEKDTEKETSTYEM